ncbi:outer membrane protein [Methylocystis sp. JAN1]|uniref:outer membrane protein n=1 Tax=Methylocystis sp. JAN1 TaxID=3397211 RepID=UPI003FA30C09
MKRVSLLVAASLAAVGSAFAADLPSRKAPPAPYMPPPPPPPPMWTGFYGGLNVGGGWSANRINPASTALYVSPVTGTVYALPGGAWGGGNAGGVVGGGQLGYNYQFGSSFLVGVETDFQGTSMRSGRNNNWAVYPDPLVAGGFLTPLSPAGNRGFALDWFGTVRGRAGWLVAPTLLAYGTGGFAYGDVSGGFWNGARTRVGWTAGGGLEWLFVPNWSAKTEYLFTDLGNGGAQGPLSWNWGSRLHPQFHTVRAGVNYHFNFGGAAPLLANF